MPDWSEYCGDTFWDTDLTWNTTNPRFTQCFQKTALSWTGPGFIILCLPVLIEILIKPTKWSPQWRLYSITRQALAVGLAIVALIDLILNIVNSSKTLPADIVNAVIALIFALFLNFLFYRLTKVNISSSGTVWFTLAISVICLALQLFAHESALSTQRTIIIGINLGLHVALFIQTFIPDSSLCLSDNSFQKEAASVDSEDVSNRKECPKARSTFFSRLTYSWYSPLTYIGWRRSLVMSDVWRIRPQDSAKINYEHYRKNANKGSSAGTGRTPNGKDTNNNRGSVKIGSNDTGAKIADNEQAPNRVNILRIIWSSFWRYFLPGALFKLFQDITLFINPIIMKQLMKFVNDPKQQAWHGYLFAVGLFLVTSGQIMSLNYYFNRMQTFGMRVRTTLTGAVYRKALNLSSGARAMFNTGEIVNLMAVDAQRFIEISSFINLIWSAPLQIIVSLIFLFQELGISVLGGFFFMVILIPINGYLTSLSRKLQVKQMKLKDERVKAMNEMLSGMKIIKLYGWEEAFIARVTGIRGREIRILRLMSYLNCALVVLWNLAPFLVSLITFALYVTIDSNNVLTAEKAFVSLALFNILRFPLTMLPNLVTQLIMASVSVKRLNNFLGAEELTNYITPKCCSSDNCIELENCSFRWSKTLPPAGDKKAAKKDKNKIAKSSEEKMPEDASSVNSKITLSKININIKPGSFVAIVGAVGSGKSSVLNSLLGNMELIEGDIRVSSKMKIAYTPQEAWIQNSTLRENILFNQPFDEKRYRRVVQSCSLLPDFEILPGGDLTEIGEKGINLSGGQKQRVSLARACYNDADIYLFDDPLAAVDSHVGKYIFENILHSESGLLRDKTRILVTNNLSVLPSTDAIIVLKDGQVIESGGYRDLIGVKNGHFANLIQQYSVQDNEQNHDSDDDADAEEQEDGPGGKTVESKNKSFQINKLIEKEVVETGKVKWSVYGRYLSSITWLWCAVFIVNYIVAQSANIGANVWLSYWSTETEKGIENSKTIMFLLVYGAIGISQGIFSALGYYGLTKGSLRAAFDLHNRMLHTIMRSSMAFFDVTPLGRILNRFSKDIDVCDTTISANFRTLITCLFSALGTIIIISIQLQLFLVIVLPMAIAFYFIQKLYVSTARQLKRLESTSKSPVYSHFSETLSGVSTIRAYNVTKEFIDRSDHYVDENNSCYYASLISNRWLSVRLEMMANLIVLTAATFAVLYRHDLDSAKVGLIISYALTTTQHLNYLVRSSSEVETNIVSVERILEYTDLPVEAEWNVESNAPNKDWPSEGNLEFKDYSTRYREGLDEVLRKIRLHIKAGEKIGIVGRTGAGKSSLTLALFRLIEPTNGTIVIDGIDISKIGLHQLRQHLTIIPQDPILFSGTIRTNLDPFNERTDDELWRALELAHLKRFVQSNSEGLEYVITESGGNLSMGQRQLVCLARALLRKSKVLVLDEATATVDMETDELIGKTIRSSFADCTIFTIAHRLHTIMDSNRVLVLNNGEVSEFDTPQNLLNNTDSVFYSMVDAAGMLNNK